VSASGIAAPGDFLLALVSALAEVRRRRHDTLHRLRLHLPQHVQAMANADLSHAATPGQAGFFECLGRSPSSIAKDFAATCPSGRRIRPACRLTYTRAKWRHVCALSRDHQRIGGDVGGFVNDGISTAGHRASSRPSSMDSSTRRRAETRMVDHPSPPL